MLEILLLLAEAQAPHQTVAYREIEGKTPKQLAALLFSAEVERQIVDGRVGRVFGLGHQYGVRLWTRPRPVDETFCERTVHATSVENLDAPWSEVTPSNLLLAKDEIYRSEQFAPTFPEQATETSCAGVTGYISPSEKDRPAALATVRQLLSAIQAARANAPLSFEIHCREERVKGWAGCADARVALANIPLETMYRIDFNTGRYEQVPGMGPGVIQQLPPTPEHPGVPTINFGPARNGDGLSWKATLNVKDGKLVSIDLGKTMVTYH